MAGSNYISGVQTWTFEETSLGLAAVIISYLILVLKILPSFMKNRQPLHLKKTLLFYNIFQVFFSFYAVFLYTRYIMRHGLIITRCPKGEDLQVVITEIMPYFLAKHLDLLDTVFFVLRKKDNQVTFLHVFHHALMVTWAWFYRFYHPTDHFVVVGLINSFVHVLMYAYYGISSLGPDYAKYVWWKKHLTKVQLIQFILVEASLYFQQKLTPCPIPSLFHYFSVSSIASFFILFMNFYLKSYFSKSKKKTPEKGVEKNDMFVCAIKSK
ncbi:elongation of very long chain fatty acids protein 7-like [Bicyclus anynana]|uniref:Elongation of very long chain fatty acids protein n=1 Tax=Bicyclus anynana TaxID=110368 RepID=A0ABM3LH23_BICAN|nr:elongation of very long chain fatty acids protein 7-like [Bicyclus anynana]